MSDSRDDAYAKIGEENFLLQSANAKIEQLTEILRDRGAETKPSQEEEEEEVRIHGISQSHHQHLSHSEPSAAREHQVIPLSLSPLISLGHHGVPHHISD